jgi:tetratricopeptide (TPR) repeat protein
LIDGSPSKLPGESNDSRANCASFRLNCRIGNATMNKAKTSAGSMTAFATGSVIWGLQKSKRNEAELIAAALAEGVKLHQAGRLFEAEIVYTRILGARPDHFDCLHLLGLIFYQRGNHEQALRRIDLALQKNPNSAPALNSRGIALCAQSRYDEALASFSRAVSLRPDFAEAHSNRGNALRELGRFDEAIKSYDRAIKLRPDYADAHSNLGNALRQCGRFDEALASCDRAITLQPQLAEAHCNRGTALLRLKRFDEALESCDRAIALRSNFAEAYYNRGKALTELGRFNDALQSYDDALKPRPNFPEALSSRGIVLGELRRLDEALESCDRAIALRPDFAEAYCDRAMILRELGRLDEAVESCDRAIALRPQCAEAYSNRGNSLLDLKRFDEALRSIESGLVLRPDFAAAHSNRGMALAEMNRIDEAIASFERAQALQPDFAEAHLNEAQYRLRLGDFKRGWEKYETRWQAACLKDSKRPFSQALWLGSDEIAGKTVLVHAEQGLGDTIQFCRYVPLVAARGARVIFEVQRPLRALMTSLAGGAQIVAAGDRLPDFDLHCPLLSLPLAFGTRLDTIPCETRYLSAPPGRAETWRDLLGEHNRPRVGLVWAGNPRKHMPAATRIDQERSIAFERLGALFEIDACSFYSLQKGDDAVKQLHASAWRGRVLDFTDDLHDFSDTAALIENLDLVISVDTSVLHLAGALGKPVWLMNRYNTCWRWLSDREDSPWYRNLRQFRQDARRDWDPVIARIAEALRDYVGGFR